MSCLCLHYLGSSLTEMGFGLWLVCDMDVGGGKELFTEMYCGELKVLQLDKIAASVSF